MSAKWKSKSTVEKVATVAAGAAAAGVVTAGTRAWIRRAGKHIAPNGASGVVVRTEPEEGGWRVSVAGDTDASASFDTKKEAVSAGRRLARDRAPSELIIHGVDGAEQRRHRYEA